MQLNLVIYTKPISVNEMYSAGKKVCVGKKSYTPIIHSWTNRKYKKALWHELLLSRENIFAFASQFNQGIHALRFKYKYISPDVFTKSGRLSKTGMDCSNFIKSMEDGLFSFMQQCNPNIDDAHVNDLRISKQHGESMMIHVYGEIVRLNQL